MKINKRIWLFLLVLTLVFSLTFSTVASALPARDFDSVSSGLSNDQLNRQDMWEDLNLKVIEIEHRFLDGDITGNYFTDYYLSSLTNAVKYAKKLIDAVSASYSDLKEMCDELDYMVKESENPANHELVGSHYTIAFTDTMNWGKPIYVYVWNSKGFFEAQWPGTEMTGSYVNEFGQKQYYAYVGEDCDYVIFSNGSQTVDIPLYDKTGYFPTGEVDANGNYKVSSWHLSAPHYKEYDLSDPTEPTVVIPTEQSDEIPRLSPDHPDEDYINWFLPKFDSTVKLKLRTNDSQLQSELYDLILSVDRSVAAPGNNYPDDYRERVIRVRNHSASVYNHDSSADHELTGAIRSLQFALDGESWGRIIDCLSYYFIYADYSEMHKTDEEQYNLLKKELYTKTFERNQNDEGKRALLGQLLSDVHHSIYDLDGREFSQSSWSDRVKMLTAYQSALDVYYDLSSSDDHCRRIYEELMYVYSGLIPPVTDPSDPTEPKEEKFKPGEVLISLKPGSTDVNSLLKGFEIESVRLLTPGSSRMVYHVVFKEKSSDIVYRAIETLNQSEYVEIAEPNYLGSYTVMVLRGDADLDGAVTVLDATKIQRVLASLTAQTSAFDAVCGDVNGDGLDIIDATAIQRYLAGLGNPYGIGEEYSLS